MSAQHGGVVIVGGGLAGLTTAEGLRAEGYSGDITMVGDEGSPPYSRPPLSKQILAGEWGIDRAMLCDTDHLVRLGVRHLGGHRVTHVDLATRAVSAGSVMLPFEQLVVATGVSARRLPNPRSLRGIHALRTTDDARQVQRDLARGGRVVVVGAGVLGCEIASAVRASGHDVTLVGRSSGPRLARAGGLLSSMIAGLMVDHDVRLRMGVDVVDIEGHDTVSGLRLSDGSFVPADVVIAAIGCTPSVHWLAGTGIDISDGVLCDRNGVAAPGVYAVGDVARWHDPLTGEARRIEHQAAAIERANAIAHLIATGEPTTPMAAFFWSELFGTRILVHGQLDPDAQFTVMAGDVSRGRFVGATLRAGQPSGLVGWNMPREFHRERARLIRQSAEFAEQSTSRALV